MTYARKILLILKLELYSHLSWSSRFRAGVSNRRKLSEDYWVNAASCRGLKKSALGELTVVGAGAVRFEAWKLAVLWAGNSEVVCAGSVGAAGFPVLYVPLVAAWDG